MNIRIDGSAHLRRLNEIERRTLFGCMAYGKAAAMKLAKEAKQNRPWTDRTHLARRGLTGSAAQHGAKIRVELSHTTKYGVFLELKRFRHKGRLAIVFPTVKKMAPEIIEGWAAVVRKGG